MIKEYKVFLLGIALLLFSISIGVMKIGYDLPDYLIVFVRGLPFIGFIVCCCGLIAGDNKNNSDDSDKQ